MAPHAKVTRTGKTRATLEATAAIADAEVAFAAGQAAAFPAAGTIPAGYDAYFLAGDPDEPEVDADGLKTVNARVLGLSEAEFDGGTPLVIDAKLRPGPFFAKVTRGTQPIEARIDNVPDDVLIRFTPPAATSPGNVTYNGSAEIGQIVVDATKPTGFIPGASELDLTIGGLPSTLNLDIGAAKTGAALRAGEDQSVGLVQLLLGDGSAPTDAEEDKLADDQDGAIVRDRPGEFYVFTRARQIERAVARKNGNKVQVEYDTPSGNRLLVDARQRSAGATEDRFVRLALDHLVADMTLDVDLPKKPGQVPATPRDPDPGDEPATQPNPDDTGDVPATQPNPDDTGDVPATRPTPPVPGTIAYTGAARIDEIVVDAFDPDEFIERATTLHGVVKTLPPGVNLEIGRSRNEDVFHLDAGGDKVGLVELTLSDGSEAVPGDEPAAEFDGLFIRDLPDRFRLFARVNGLRGVKVEKGSATTTLGLDATANRVFQVDVHKPPTADPCVPPPPAGKVEKLFASISRLRPETVIELTDFGGCVGRKMHYEAAGRADRVRLETNAGNRVLLQLDVRDLADRIDICTAKDGRCTPDPRDADTSLEVDASSEVEIARFVDCVVAEDPEGERTAEDACRGILGPPADAQPVNEFVNEGTIADIDRITYLGFDKLSQKGDGEGHLSFDTADSRDQDAAVNEGTTLAGTVWMDKVDGPIIRAIFGPTFKADHRLAIIDGAGFAIERTTGLVQCDDQTDVEANTKALPSVDVTGRLCSDD